MSTTQLFRIYLLAALLPAPGISFAQTIDNTKNKEVYMSAAQLNKANIQKLYEQCLNQRNLSLLPELIADEYTGPGGKQGAEAFAEPVLALVKAFPDIQWKVTDVIAEGDKVAVRWQVQGTHTGQFQQIAATGKKVANDGAGIFTLKNGKVTGNYVLTDRISFLQQLGVLPADLSSLPARKD